MGCKGQYVKPLTGEEDALPSTQEEEDKVRRENIRVVEGWDEDMDDDEGPTTIVTES